MAIAVESQPLNALAKANRVRLARAWVKREIAAGRVHAAQVILEPAPAGRAPLSLEELERLEQLAVLLRHLVAVLSGWARDLEDAPARLRRGRTGHLTASGEEF